MKRIIGTICFVMYSIMMLADIPPTYYDSANGKKKADLKSALHAIIASANVLDYGSGAGKTWTGFYTTDRYNGNQVRDRYSNEVFYFSSTASATSASAVSGMNIEHSFPKSWWGGAQNQAYKDLYNLMPCEAEINSSKSNYAMGVVTSANVADNGCTKVGTGKAGTQSTTLWEPADKWKGDFARNYFYMVTAYSNLTWTSKGLDMLQNDEWPTLKKWAYELFLEWNREDPVDEIEKTRNEAVYGIQGNRNPFIDFPNLAEYIWGDSIDVAFSVDGTKIDPIDSPDMAVLEQDFTSDCDGWLVDDVFLPEGFNTIWIQNAEYGMKSNAYRNSTCYDSESWLISPKIDLSELQDATLTFSHTGNYFGTMTEEATLWISTDGGKSWSQLPINTYMTGKDWVFVNNATDLTAYCGGTINIAFKYTSTTSAAGQWEIKNVYISGTKKEAEPTYDTFTAFEANEIVSSVYSTRFDANWAKYAEGVIYTLDVYTKDDEGSRTSFTNFPDTTNLNTYRVKGITPKTTYYYEVYVYNEDGSLKAKSNEVQVDFPAVTPVFTANPTQAIFSTVPNSPSQPIKISLTLMATQEKITNVEVESPFEISEDENAANWQQSLTLNGASPIFYVRMSAVDQEGEYKGKITLSTKGVDDMTIPLEASVDNAKSFFESFEKAGKSSYAEASVVGTAATWMMTDAMIAKDVNANDMYSMRMRKCGTAVMITDKENGCDSLWFNAALYNSKYNKLTLKVSYSLDQGNTWTSIVEDLTPTSEWKRYCYAVEQSGNIRLKFELNSTTNDYRINIDDIQMSDYVAPTGISRVEDASEMKELHFDLSGRRAVEGSKGIVLKKGRKWLQR